MVNKCPDCGSENIKYLGQKHDKFLLFDLSDTFQYMCNDCNAVYQTEVSCERNPRTETKVLIHGNSQITIPL